MGQYHMTYLPVELLTEILYYGLECAAAGKVILMEHFQYPAFIVSHHCHSQIETVRFSFARIVLGNVFCASSSRMLSSG